MVIKGDVIMNWESAENSSEILEDGEVVLGWIEEDGNGWAALVEYDDSDGWFYLDDSFVDISHFMVIEEPTQK